jgi:hypothetical protein
VATEAILGCVTALLPLDRSMMLQKLAEVLAIGWANLSQNLSGLIGLIGVFTLFALAGAAVSKERTLVLMIVRGWALTVLLAIVLALLSMRSLTTVLAALAVLAATGFWRLRRYPVDTRGLVPSLVLGAPLLILGAMVPATFFDTYLHWLPNARYLVEFDHLIAAPLPAGFFSMHPVYPPALALPVYLASRLTGEFAIGAAQTLAGALAVVTTQQIVLMMAPTLRSTGIAPHGYGAALLALAALILLNPAINTFGFWPALQSIQYWSYIADPPLAFLMVITLLTLVLRLARPDPAMASGARGIQPGSVATLIALGVMVAALKPNGIVLILIVMIATLLVSIAAALPLRRTVVALMSLATGTLITDLLWRVYLADHLPVSDQLGLLPLEHWRLDLFDELLVAWWEVIGDNLMFYALSVLTVVAGMRALQRRRSKTLTPLALLLGIAGIAFLGHIASLLLAFVGIGFDDWAIRSADSMQRYGGQVALASCTASLLLLSVRIIRSRRFARAATTVSPLAFAGIALLAYVPTLVAAAGNIRYYDEARKPPRRLALTALQMLPPHTRVAVVGETWPAIFTRYLGWAGFAPASRPRVLASLQVEKRVELPRSKEIVDGWLQNPGIDCVILLNGVDFAQSYGLAALPDQLWCRSDPRWQPLHIGTHEIYRLN